MSVPKWENCNIGLQPRGTHDYDQQLRLCGTVTLFITKQSDGWGSFIYFCQDKIRFIPKDTAEEAKMMLVRHAPGHIKKQIGLLQEAERNLELMGEGHERE